MSQSCNPCGFWNGFGLVVDLSNSRQTDVSVLLRHGTSNLESTRPAAGLSLAMNRAGRWNGKLFLSCRITKRHSVVWQIIWYVRWNLLWIYYLHFMIIRNISGILLQKDTIELKVHLDIFFKKRSKSTESCPTNLGVNEYEHGFIALDFMLTAGVTCICLILLNSLWIWLSYLEQDMQAVGEGWL